jgi:hypothetical protein
MSTHQRCSAWRLASQRTAHDTHTEMMAKQLQLDTIPPMPPMPVASTAASHPPTRMNLAGEGRRHSCHGGGRVGQPPAVGSPKAAANASTSCEPFKGRLKAGGRAAFCVGCRGSIPSIVWKVHSMYWSALRS